MITMGIAPSGYGKSAMMMHDAIIKYSRWGRKIYTNMDMAIPHSKITTVDEIMQIENADIYIDEFDTVFGDARNSNKAENIAGTIAAKIARKKNVSLYGTVQMRSMNDIRLRANTDVEKNPCIVEWVNMLTGADMPGPLSFKQQEMVEMTLDERGDRIWQPGLIRVLSKKMSGDHVIHSELNDISCQSPIYKDLCVLECYDTSQLLLKATPDNDALKKAVALEGILAKMLKVDMWGYGVLQMPQSGFNLSYSTSCLKYTCLDIHMFHPSGHNVWIDVVGLTKDKGYDTVRTAHKDWDDIVNSIAMHGPLAEGYLAYFYKESWHFCKIDLDTPAFRTVHTDKVKKSDILISRLMPQSIQYEEWIDIVREEGQERVSNGRTSGFAFAPVGVGEERN